MIGRVVSVKALKTITVLVEGEVTHPLYKKVYKQSKKYLVDTSDMEIKLGDIVNFIPCKPISKRKAFKATKVLGKSFAEIAEGQLKELAEETIAEVMPEDKKEVEVAGSSEVVKESEEKKEKPKRVRKEKLAPKP